MSLRLQLLALGALTLLLPWAGLRFLQQTEASLRDVHEGQLLGSAGTLAVQMGGNDSLIGASAAAPGLAAPLYAHPLSSLPRPDGSRGPRLDGSRGDWRYENAAPGADDSARAIQLADGSRLWLGIFEGFLYVFVEVVDEDVVRQPAPGRAPHGDRIALLYDRDAFPPQAVLLAIPVAADPRATAGSLRAQRTTGPDRYESTGEFVDDVRASWAATEGSGRYAVEALMALGLVDGAFGIAIIDTDVGGSSVRLAATTWGDVAAPGPLVHERAELDSILRPFADDENRRFRILDPDGSVLADSRPLGLAPASGGADETSLTESFFRYTLRRSDPPYSSLESTPGKVGDPALLAAMRGVGGTAWFGTGSEASAIVAAIVPIRRDDRLLGAILLEQATDPIMTLANEATLRLMGTTALISLIAAALLLGYASYLSFRVGRLARAAESALGPHGEIRVALPGTRARDEIGVLARSFEDLLGRLREYTEYLQSLKSKLGHELRTPLAIVATSLDNLEQEAGTPAGRAYLARLRHGTSRLESILQAMTAATRVEQAVTQTTVERFDLVKVTSACVAAYGDAYAGQKFGAALPAEPVWVEGSPELIEQLLDKLVDNAVSFAAEGSTIDVSLTSDDGEARLAVVNRGPPLPEAMRHRLFDSLVSVRASGGERAHLGLGLYIVTLIARFHGGRVEADNLPNGSGVRIGVVLPIA